METHRQSNKALLEKDNEIARLKLVLNAHIARTSLTQARLLATQDALDAVNASHAQELNDLLLAKNNLKRKLRVYHEFVKKAEMERDDLRDAAVSLVEKVDACNDYTLWPHSRMHISSLLDPVDSSPPPSRKLPQTGSDDDLLAYAAAMIDALTAERDVEKRAHECTRRLTTERISALEAQLALRESELETCVAHTAECFQVPSNAADESELKAKPVEQEVAIRILELAAAKHRTMQKHNEYLIERLEAARQNLASVPRTSSTTRSERKMAAEDVQTNIPAATEGRPDETDDTVRGKRSDSGRKESGVSATPALVEEMDLGIRELGNKIEAFKLEKERLLDMIANENGIQKPDLVSQYYSPEHRDQTELPPSWSSQHETIEYLLELEKAYQSSLQREKLLIEENAQLRKLRNHDSPQVNKTHLDVSSNVPDPSLLLDAQDGEVSMELATPLLPTSLIVLPTTSPGGSSGPGEATPGDDIDRLLDEASIPLPPSPPSPDIQPYSSTPLLPAAVLEQRSHNTDGVRPGLPDADLQFLDAELAHAQQQLTEGQKALQDIEYVLDNIQHGGHS